MLSLSLLFSKLHEQERCIHAKYYSHTPCMSVKLRKEEEDPGNEAIYDQRLDPQLCLTITWTKILTLELIELCGHVVAIMIANWLLASYIYRTIYRLQRLQPIVQRPPLTLQMLKTWNFALMSNTRQYISSRLGDGELYTFWLNPPPLSSS